MLQTLQASDLSLNDVETTFGLKECRDTSFFPEWQENLPTLTTVEQQSLDQIKANFLYLSKWPTTEDVVKLVVLSPLLSMAGFYSPPFRIRSEASIQLSLEEEGKEVRGRIDVLVLQDQLWVLVVESKESSFSLKAAIPQCLAYMMAAPDLSRPVFGLVTNGSEFRFLKLVHGQAVYGLSELLTLQRRDNDLYPVLAILKSLSALYR
jgi:Type I restriction enzyme R protein N terminus (HSDR_N)